MALITNVACACGLTSSNYKELVQLHKTYADQGLVIMAFPCNQVNTIWGGGDIYVLGAMGMGGGERGGRGLAGRRWGGGLCTGALEWEIAGGDL